MWYRNSFSSLVNFVRKGRGLVNVGERDRIICGRQTFCFVREQVLGRENLGEQGTVWIISEYDIAVWLMITLLFL